MLNEQFSTYIHRDDQDTFYLFKKMLFESKKPQTSELRMRHLNGGIISVILKASITQELGGTIVCHVAAIHSGKP
jgi:hypothetical protein